jgi:hypothetical protein
MLTKEMLAEELKVFRQVMKEKGVQHVHMDFHGSGDSGTMERPELTPESLEKETVEWAYKTYGMTNYQTREYVEKDHLVTMTLIEVAEMVLERQVDSHDVDWFNDDGGEGHVSLDMETGEYEIVINQFYTESNTVVCENYSLDDPETIEAEMPAVPVTSVEANLSC